MQLCGFGEGNEGFCERLSREGIVYDPVVGDLERTRCLGGCGGVFRWSGPGEDVRGRHGEVAGGRGCLFLGRG